MPLKPNRSDAARIAIFLTILATLILLMAGLQAARVQAGEGVGEAQKLITGTRTHKPEKSYSTAVTLSKLCGQLVYLTNAETGVGLVGLRPCGRGGVYIFKTHPRDLVPFYQIRDADVASGAQVITDQYGCLDTYITGFKNYVGIQSCDQCGMYMLPPTWTVAPLTPYTPTPRPPTATLYVPSPTPTDTATLSLAQVTQTPGLFELLFGTNTPTTSLTATPSPSTVAHTATSSVAPAAVSPTVAPSRASPFRSPLVLGIGLLMVMIGLAYLVWLSAMRSRQD